MTFLVFLLQTTVATPTLSAFPCGRLSSVIVNSAAKNILIRVSPPPGWCHSGRSPAPLVTPLIQVTLLTPYIVPHRCCSVLKLISPETDVLRTWSFILVFQVLHFPVLHFFWSHILPFRILVSPCGTENAGVENAIRTKVQGWKMQE